MALGHVGRCSKLHGPDVACPSLRYAAEPPQWPCIRGPEAGSAHTLPEFWDMSRGRVADGCLDPTLGFTQLSPALLQQRALVTDVDRQPSPAGGPGGQLGPGDAAGESQYLGCVLSESQLLALATVH